MLPCDAAPARSRARAVEAAEARTPLGDRSGSESLACAVRSPGWRAEGAEGACTSVRFSIPVPVSIEDRGLAVVGVVCWAGPEAPRRGARRVACWTGSGRSSRARLGGGGRSVVVSGVGGDARLRGRNPENAPEWQRESILKGLGGGAASCAPRQVGGSEGRGLDSR